MKRILGTVLIITLLWACTTDNDGEGSEEKPEVEATFARGPILSNWADNIIIPSYEAFNADLVAFNTAIEVFASNTNAENLIALRNAWVKAYTTWQRASMFEIGPAETVGLRLNLNIYPTNPEKINDHMASGSFNLSLSSNRDAKGFPALDYLINGLEDTDAAIVAKYNGTDKGAMMAYMKAVLDDMISLSSGVLTEWKSGYRDTFVANDGASATAAVDRMVNDYIFYYEKFLRAGKMGIPLGVFSGSTLAGNVEAFYQQDLSNILFLEGLNAAQDFFNGKHYGSNASGESLASYLDALNTVKNGENLKTTINNQFNTARAAVTALASFRTEIEENNPPTNMLLAYDEVQRIVPLIKVDMVSAMSISIDFVDADGD